VDAALKAEIQEIVELVKTVPESLQVRTLELLLQDLLDRTGEPKRPAKHNDENNEEDEPLPGKERTERRAKSTSEGLNPGTLPMRLKAFMKRTQVTIGQIDRLFHVEGKQIEPIWTLKSTKFSKTQVEIALLQSLQRAITLGEFSFDRELVREECIKRGGYNKTNFVANFRNNGKYFSGLDKDGLVSLSDEGMTALAALVNDLAGVKDGD